MKGIAIQLLTAFLGSLGFSLLFFTLHLMAMRTEIWRRRVAAMRRIAARSADRQDSAASPQLAPRSTRDEEAVTFSGSFIGDLP